jgi:hypothetical protein
LTKGYSDLLTLGLEMNCPLSAEALKNAAKLPSPLAIPLLAWLKDRDCSFNSSSLESSATSGNLETFRWLLDQNVDWRLSFLGSAAREGHWEIVRWAVAECYIEPAVGRPLNHEIPDFPKEAARQGNLEVLIWLHEEKIYPLGFAHCERIAGNRGHVYVLEWLRENQSRQHSRAYGNRGTGKDCASGFSGKAFSLP